MDYKNYIDSEENMNDIASEDVSVAYTGGQSQLDAVWESIVNQTSEVQKILLSRLTKLCASSVKPYTYEEIKARIDESEAQMEAGEVTPGKQVHEEMRNYLKSLTA